MQSTSSRELFIFLVGFFFFRGGGGVFFGALFCDGLNGPRWGVL